MTAPRRLAGLSDIAARYDALLCDAWGVIHDGVRVFPGVAEALTAFSRTRGPVVVLTNAPRPSSVIPAQLERVGLPRAGYAAVVTAGDAAKRALAARLPAPVYRLGPDKDDPLFDGLSIDFAPLDRAAFIICTGLVNDFDETPDSYRPLLEEALARRLPMICANPDIVVRWGGRLIYCAGAIAELYETIGGEVIYGGKPHPEIYDLAFASIAARRGAPIDRRRALVVGDGLSTDVLGANRQGLDCLLVAGEGGVHDGAPDDATIAAGLARAGVRADYVMEFLTW